MRRARSAFAKYRGMAGQDETACRCFQRSSVPIAKRFSHSTAVKNILAASYSSCRRIR